MSFVHYVASLGLLHSLFPGNPAVISTVTASCEGLTSLLPLPLQTPRCPWLEWRFPTPAVRTTAMPEVASGPGWLVGTCPTSHGGPAALCLSPFRAMGWHVAHYKTHPWASPQSCTQHEQPGQGDTLVTALLLCVSLKKQQKPLTMCDS